MSGTCIHCGSPVPAGQEDVRFCCHGCASAHAWIAQAGLDQFYQLRVQSEPGPLLTSQNDAAPNYAHFDDPDYLSGLGLVPGNSELSVIGLSCAACVWLLEQLPSRVPGLSQVRVNWQAQRVHLVWDPETLPLSRIAQVFSTLGYKLVADDQAARDLAQRARRKELLRLAITGACAGNVMLVSLALYSGELSDMGPQFRQLFELFAAIFTLPCVAYGAAPFYKAALASLRIGRLHLDVPIACGVLVGFSFAIMAMFTGEGDLYFDTISLLVFLLLLGRRLQDESRRWAYSQAGALNVLLPASTLVQREGQWKQISRLQLEDGDLVRVEPGQQVPADGSCEAGESQVDARSLTGESHPIPVAPGAAVLAGTTNLDAAFCMRVTARGEQSRLGRVAKSLTSADKSRTKVQRAVDRVSGWFSWAVLGTALTAAAYWYQAQGAQAALDVALATLIISCPCALGLATPLALALARAKAARMGILVARDSALEELDSIPDIAFDKTGTLSTGEIRVIGTQSELSTPALKSLVAGLEQGGTHPIARGLVRWAHPATPEPSLSMITEVPGQGVRAKWGQRELRLGRFKDSKSRAAIAKWRARYPTDERSVYFFQDSEVIASLELSDDLRPGAPAWIQELRAQGKKLKILSGDSQQAVAGIAKTLGIQEALHELSPEDKLSTLQRFPSVMVGDGINDAPALRCATVGIAVGQNAEIAAKVADIYVMRPSIPTLRALFDLARDARRVVKRNLSFALAYNLVFATAACMGQIRPLVAAIIMPLSSLTVLLSSWWTMRKSTTPAPD